MEEDITAFVTPQMASSFNIEALLNSHEFDLLLTSIERDLDDKASLAADSKTGRISFSLSLSLSFLLSNFFVNQIILFSIYQSSR